jgi:hypothetical protein
VRRERASAVPSLDPAEAGAAAGSRLRRRHWVRDVGSAEDRSPARAGGVPQALAALRSTAIGLRRAHGHQAIAAARRRLAHDAPGTLALMGLPPGE